MAASRNSLGHVCTVVSGGGNAVTREPALSGRAFNVTDSNPERHHARRYPAHVRSVDEALPGTSAHDDPIEGAPGMEQHLVDESDWLAKAIHHGSPGSQREVRARFEVGLAHGMVISEIHPGY